ncbi:hypothetical protein AAC387_Pa04g0559 [Persea americana]
MATTDVAPTGPSIAKQLASCNARTRFKAVRLLQSHLPSQPSIPEDEMKKIWKGLFYCVWHADKQQHQLDLIERLSSLLRTLPPPLSLLYFSSFLLTVRREWPGIDFLRLDKFYLLIRRFVRHLFILLASRSWDPLFAAQFLDALCETSLLPADGLPAQGVSYHIADVFWDELKGFLPLPKGVLEMLLKPFIGVLEKSADKVLLGKVRSGVFEPLLGGGRWLLERGNGNLEEKAEVGGDEKEKFGVVAVSMGFARMFLQIASLPERVQANRKVLFALHEVFKKLEREFERSGIEVSLPGAVEIAEVSLELVEQESGSLNGLDGENPEKKKSKKAKKMSNGVDKKSKSKEKKKKKNGTREGVSDDPVSIETVTSLEDENDNGGNAAISFNETVISNLQKQFEKVAAEAGMDIGTASLSGIDTMPVGNTVSKKRKRGKNVDGQVSLDMASNGDVIVGGSANGKSSEKSAKKVKFSMKSNLVWKPHSPLPPQSLRLPPSVTPRGSALKKGVLPGPIRETALVKKVKRRTNPLKKDMKGLKKGAVKRLRKLRPLPV